MSNVEFDEEQSYVRPKPEAPHGSAMARLVIASGLAKDEKGAERVLLIIAGLCVLLAAGVYIFGRDQGPPVPQSVIDASLPAGAQQ